MARNSYDLKNTRYQIARELGYVEHTASWAIPYSTVDYLKWDVDFEMRLEREASMQFMESGGRAKLESEREERHQAWLNRRAAMNAQEN